MNRLRTLCCVAACLSLAPAAFPDTILPAQEQRLDDLSGFAEAGDNWKRAARIAGNPRTEEKFDLAAGTGLIANTAAKGEGSNLFTSWDHGDIELSLEFLLPQGSNSGVYLQSRYEVQLFDSWGVENAGYADCGGIYQRWDNSKNQGFEGFAPSTNASRAPGLWQKLHIIFQAPRFDASGQKTQNAKFIEVALNGYVIHRNVEVSGPTRAAAHGDETARAPLMIQGDHGPVALRNIQYKAFTDASVEISNLSCIVRDGEGLKIGEYDEVEPSSRPELERINVSDLPSPKNFAATFEGSIQVPNTGAYAFHAQAGGPTQLLVDGKLALAALSPGGRPISIHLEKGSHPFRLDYTHGRWGKPRLDLQVEGPGIRLTSLNTEPEINANTARDNTLIIEAQNNRVRVQRAFIPFHPLKRLYAIAVGSPNHTHFAYDFDTASLLYAWQGAFLDTFEMWDGRGHNQIGKPAGPSLSLFARPNVALVESTDHDWPDRPDELWTSKGYVLDSQGNPTFLAQLADLEVRDRIVSKASPRQLERQIEIEGGQSSWWTALFLAEAAQIETQDDGYFVIGDRDYYIDVPSSSELQPFVRSFGDKDQLMVWVPKSAWKTSLRYNLVW